MYAVIQDCLTWYQLDGRHVVRRRRWAHAPVFHSASHFDHKERVAWVTISMHTYGSVSIIMELCWSSAKIQSAPSKFKQHCFIVLKQAFLLEAQGHT